MFGLEYIKQMNEQVISLRENRNREINEYLLRIKRAIDECIRIDAEIVTSSRLRKENPDKEQQLLVAEAFYRQKRSEVMSRQCDALRLRQAIEDNEYHLQRYTKEKLQHEGIIITENVNGDQELLKQSRRRLGEVVQRSESLATLNEEIENVLKEYSQAYGRDPTYYPPPES
jgi:hypothetical protein